MRFSSDNNSTSFKSLNVIITLHKAVFFQGHPKDIVLKIDYKTKQGAGKSVRIGLSRFRTITDEESTTCLFGVNSKPVTVTLEEVKKVKIRALSTSKDVFCFDLVFSSATIRPTA